MKNQTKITKSVLDRISNFVICRENETKILTKKLSDLYSSRSTNYASIYNSGLFVIDDDKEVIVKSGYSRACKAIITLNLQNKSIQAAISDLENADKRERVAKKEAEILFEQQKKEAEIWISKNTEIVEKEAKKIAEKFGREFKNVDSMSSREKQQLAWFLLKNFTNNTKTAIFHVL